MSLSVTYASMILMSLSVTYASMILMSLSVSTQLQPSDKYDKITGEHAKCRSVLFQSTFSEIFLP